MKRLHEILHWLEIHRDFAYSLIRIYVGIALFVRGWMLLVDPSVITELAGAQDIEITPKRRSAVLIDLPDTANVDQWPLCFGAGETFYFKPMGGKLMLSPADATPVEPHDAWADDMALAEAVEKFQNVIDHEVTHIGHTWGGLRCFAQDGNPVAGFDENIDNFFWLAGQGGYGIQTAPALSQLTAALINGRQIPEDIAAQGLEQAAISPARFGR